MASISGMYTALSGMNAQRLVLDVTAHNIANEQTPGYHRQRAELSAAGVAAVSAVFAGDSMNFGGVEVTTVTRIADDLAEARLVKERAGSAGAEQALGDLSRIESVFPEPSENGLGATLDALWSGFSDLASNPADLTARSQTLQRATAVVDSIRRAGVELEGVEATARGEVENLAVDINTLANQVSQLNSAISASSTPPNDLTDQRDQIVQQLGSLVGAVARPAEGGQVNLSVGGRVLVAGPIVQAVSGTGGALVWEGDGSAVDSPPSKASALRTTIETTVPTYLASLDTIANDLVTQVNAVHSAGYDRNGNTGNNFFNPAGTTAASIAISSDVAGQPDRIAAGAPVMPGPTAPGIHDGEQARALAALGESPTGPSREYRAMVTKLGVDVSTARRRNSVQTEVTRAVEAQAASVGGVSLDEEMATLMSSQRAYEASARVLTTIDELLGYLIERVAV